MHARGTFEVKMTAEPPYAEHDGLSFGRYRFDKTFSGALSATSLVQMVGVRSTDPNVRAYVAVERIEGTLAGRAGSFVVIHQAVGESFTLTIMPGSGTGALLGITGGMRIEITDGQHFYEIDYELPA